MHGLPPDDPGLRNHKADAELVGALRADGFCGPRYEVFERELALYGLAVLDAKLRSGEIFALVARIGRPVKASDDQKRTLAVDSHDREELAADVIGRTLPWFKRDALVGGGWHPDGGASLTTYFINASFLTFKNPFESWQRQYMRRPTADGSVGYYINHYPSPEDQAILREEVRERLAELPEKTRMNIVLQEAGYSYAEIAELTSDTSAAVARRLQRWANQGTRPGTKA